MDEPWKTYQQPAAPTQPEGPWDAYKAPAAPTATAPTPEPVGFTGAVARGFKRSLPETKSLLYGAGAAVAGALGADGLRDSALENYQRIQREEVEPLANQQSFKRSLTGDGSFAEWAGDTIGNFGGQALQSAAIGAAGAAVGGGAGAPAGGVGAAPGAVIGGVAGTVGSVVARGAIKKAITESVEKLVADQVKKGVGREAAEAAGRVALQRKLQQTGGAALATAALNTGQEIGIGYTGRATDAAEAGEELTRKDALRAIGWGIPAGLLDTASEAVLAGRAVKGGKATQGLTRRVLSGAGKGAATEGATEGAQAVMERAGAAQALTGTEAYDDYLENVAAGALGGGVMGGGSSIRRSLDPASPAANGEQTQGQDQTQRALPAPGPITVDPFGNAETPDQAYAREQALRNPTNDPSIIDGEFTEVPPAAPPGQLALPPPGGLDNTIDVGPDGTAVPANVTPLQDEVTAANVQARTRLGLTPDVNAARARHPAAIPNALPDGSPLPDPTNGVLSRVVNQAHGDGTLMEAAVQQAEASLQAQADAQAPAIEKAQQEQAAAQEKATKEATAAAEKKAADALKPASNSMAPAYRDQLKSLLHDSADMDSLPDSKTIEKTYGLKPREADELRREVIIERRTIANEATRNVAAAAGPDAQGAVAAGGMDNGGDAVGAADVPGGPAGQAVETAAAAPQANVARAPNAPLSYDDDHDVLDTDITPPSGGPFTSKGAADLQAGRFKDAKTVSVYGGFVVRVPKGAALEPAPKAVVGQAQPVPAATTPAVTAPAAATPPTAQVAPAQPQAAAATAPQSVPDTGPPQAKTRVVKGKREYIETAPETLAAYYLPGELVPSYGGGQDRVVSFHPAENGKNWSVKVQAVDKQGNPLPGEDGLVRKHRTLPSQKELVKTLGAAQAPSRANRVIGAKPKAKRKVVKTDKLGKPMDLLQVLAGSGLDRDQWAKYAGVDPSQFTQKVGFNYLFRKRKPSEPDVPVGMTPNDVREMMQQEGYLPADDPHLPPTVDDNDAIDLVMRALNGGELIYAEDQAEAVARYAEQEEAANAEYEAAQKAAAGFEDWMEASPESEEEVSYDQLLDRAFELGATEAELNDAVMGGAPAMQQLVTRLESEDGRRAVEEAQGDAAQEIVGEGQDQGAAGGRLEEGRPDADDEESTVPGFQLAAEAVTEPAASNPKPAQSGLFAAPTTKDLVDDAQRRRDAERDGKTGTGRTDMAGGDGELFAGPRPEQASVPERQRITRDAAENMQAGDIVVDGQGNEYRAQRARHDLLVAHPIVNGKAQVSADTEVRFLLTPEKASSYPERRADPIYATGRNVNDAPATTENQVTRILGLISEGGHPSEVMQGLDDATARDIATALGHRLSSKAKAGNIANRLSEQPRPDLMKAAERAYARMATDEEKAQLEASRPGRHKAYNDKVIEQENAIALRQRVRSDGTIGRENREPFKNQDAARKALNALPADGEFAANGFGIYKTDGGFVLRRWETTGIGAIDAGFVDQKMAESKRDEAQSANAKERGLVKDKFGNLGTQEEADRMDAAFDDDGDPRPGFDENGQSISDIANEAATSTKNDLPHPTAAQKEAGNYKKGHLSINGLNISLENPAGSRRRPEWPPLKNHYGYFKGSIGADKDHVDVFLSDQAGDASLPVFVVDQRHKNGRFDEHKVMLGFADEAAARAAYLSNYEKGWTGLKAITPMSLDEFKAWLADPAKTKVEAAAPALELTTAAKIEDFGERLEGARKFLPPSLKEELGDDQIAPLPLSKVWPSDAHEGIEDPMVAALTFAARQEIPAKPRTAYKVKRWVQTVKQFRGLVQMLGEKSMDWLVGVAEKNGSNGLVQEFFPKVRLLAQLPRETWGRVEKAGEYPNFRRMKTTDELTTDGIVLEIRQDGSFYHDYYRVDKKTGERTKINQFTDTDALFTTWPHSAVTIDGKTHTFDGAVIGPDEVQKVKELLGAEAPSKGGPKAKDFEIRVPRSSKEAFINRKGDPKYRPLKTFTGDDAVKQARAYMGSNVADLAAAWEQVKARDNVGKGDVRRDENRGRVGENRRNGKDVTEPMFEKAFGFRGVQFGNWVGQGKGARDRQGLLNDAYDSLLDLSDLLGIPSRAISLEGSLGLSLGARGAGKHAAHFEPSNLVINLTKTRGAGSLAHEWFHAMDNYFARKRGGEVPFNGNQQHYRENNYITYKPEPMLSSFKGFGTMTRAEVERRHKQNPTASAYLPENWAPSPNHKEGVRPVVEKAFAELVAALNASPMAKRASDIDGLKTRGGIISGDGYWSRIIERGARSFENYVITKMAQRGWTNDFLANIRDWEQWQQTGKNAERYPYLRPDEEGPVANAFDNLFSTIESRETGDGNVALFSQPDVSAEPFYSAMAAAVAEAKGAPKRGDAAAWTGWLDGAQRRGEFKQEERDWMGVDDWLKGQESVTREQLQDFVRANSVQVQDVVLGANPNGVADAQARLAEAGYEIDADDYFGISITKGGESVDTEDLPPALRADLQLLGAAHNADTVGADSNSDAKFAQYQLPGGENYRELLLTLPTENRGMTEAEIDQINDRLVGKGYDGLDDEQRTAALRGGNDAIEMLDDLESRVGIKTKDIADSMVGGDVGNQYRSSHFDQPNILAHVRFNERTDADGKKVLFLEEVQSDWHQAGRKGGYLKSAGTKGWKATDSGKGWFKVYDQLGQLAGEYRASDEAGAIAAAGQNFGSGVVPDAPFKTTWPMLAMKRMVRYAAENGFDRIAWTTGAQQAERYDLSKQVEALVYVKNDDGTFDIEVSREGRIFNLKDNVTASELVDIVGKDVADRMQNDAGDPMGGDARPGTRRLSGDNLKVGGAGMRAFYDKILPNEVNKFAKRFGGKVGETVISQAEGAYKTEVADKNPDVAKRLEATVHSIDLTPAMREAALGGLPMFSNSESRATRSLANQVAALKAGTTTAPMTKAQVTNATIGITSKWGANAPKVVIAVNAEGLPEWVKSNPGYRTAEGLYDDANGTVYLVASNIKAGFDSTLGRKVTARERAQMVLVHESVGHYGIEAITGPALWAELESTIDRMRQTGKHADLFAEIDRRYRGANRSIALRETIAVMAEKGIKNSVLDRVIAAMRKFLRGLGFDLRFSDSELRQHIVAAARYVKDGARPREARNASSEMVNSVDRPGWLWSQRGSVRIDGRGQRFVEQGGETFVQRGEQWYLAGKNGWPQDFLTRAAAQVAADRTGGQLEADPNEGARRTWSVILPNGMELSRAALFSQPDSEANQGQGLRDRMNARARAALDVVDRVSGGKKEFPAHWDAAQKEAAAKFATFAPKEKLSQRFDKLKSRAADTLVQRIFDQFRPLQRLSPEAFMQAHLSKATDGALEASFEHGLPVLKDGAFAIQEKDGGLRGILAKLNGEHDQFLMWMVGNRAERLKAEGREQLFTDDDIRAMKRMNQGAMADGTLRKDAYRQAMQDVNRYNKAFLDIAEKAGVVNAEARKVWEDEFYIPFYREMEKGPDLGPGQANGLLRQRVIERLVGGTDVMGDPLENMMANWSHMLTASMRNMAANKALDQAVLGGFAKPLEAPTKESVWTMRDGKKVDWQVDDKMVLEALESLNFDGYDNPLMRTAGKFKRALTIGVTASPSFRIRNMVRDSLAALGTAEVGYNPIQNMVNGWKSTAKDSDTQINLMAGGGAVRFGSFNDGDQAANAKRLIAMGVADNQILDTPAKVKNAFRRLIDGWQEVGDRAETINRAVIYDRAIAAGKTHLQASFEARDLMNFTSMGSSAAVRALAQILPFFNARLQGVDRLGRGAKANPQRFAAVAGVLAMASAALFLLNKDDDDYKALPDYVRDTYWPIKLGGKWVYLPKPFEIGALGTIVERATELATAGDDYQARDFGNTLLSVLSSQLAMNPVPQIARPLTEAAFNYDMFRGAPIDSLSQQRLLPEDRFTARTAAPAVAAGQALGVSPQKLEHVLTGYFGWLGIQALNVGDWLSRSALDLPSSPSQDLSKTNNLFVIGDFVKEAGSTSSKYVTRFYDMQRDIDAVYASANQARKAGDTDRTAQLLADPRLRMRPMFRNADNQITKINQQIRATTNNPTLSPAEKSKRLENLQAKRNLIAERIDAAARAAGF